MPVIERQASAGPTLGDLVSWISDRYRTDPTIRNMVDFVTMFGVPGLAMARVPRTVGGLRVPTTRQLGLKKGISAGEEVRDLGRTAAPLEAIEERALGGLGSRRSPQQPPANILDLLTETQRATMASGARTPPPITTGPAGPFKPEPWLRPQTPGRSGEYTPPFRGFVTSPPHGGSRILGVRQPDYGTIAPPPRAPGYSRGPALTEPPFAPPTARRTGPPFRVTPEGERIRLRARETPEGRPVVEPFSPPAAPKPLTDPAAYLDNLERQLAATRSREEDIRLRAEIARIRKRLLP